jgi:tRNA 2-selenouridine synthase
LKRSKHGAALVAANIARHIEREVLDKPRHWQPLVYCWRGGKRSGSLALVLGQIGFRVHTVEGGYKAFRGAVLAALPALAQRLQYRVVCGPTGSGKTRLLQALASQGAQVLDLEALASHRSSVLGMVPGQPTTFAEALRDPDLGGLAPL